MALKKKGTRIIHVHGIKYRWLVSGGDEGIHVIVELAENPGQTLYTRFEYDGIRTDGRYKQRRRITPDVIRQLIEYGLFSGWTPEKLLKRFEIHAPEDVIKERTL